MFKHILVPTDGSELSRKAIRSAITLARCLRLSEAEAREYLNIARAIALQESVVLKTEAVAADVTHEAIGDAAERRHCDLIFTASHGARGFRALLFGSETNKVLAHSNIPVLVYR